MSSRCVDHVVKYIKVTTESNAASVDVIALYLLDGTTAMHSTECCLLQIM